MFRARAGRPKDPVWNLYVVVSLLQATLIPVQVHWYEDRFYVSQANAVSRRCGIRFLFSMRLVLRETKSFPNERTYPRLSIRV